VSAFAQRIAALTGVPEERIEPLAADGLSEVLLVRRADGRPVVAKASPSAATEAAMRRALAAAPMVEGEYDGILLIEHVENDAVFSANAWADIGAALRRLHGRTGEAYGWPVDYPVGTVTFDNRESADWPLFWGEQRLAGTAALVDRPLRARIERLSARLGDLLPRDPPPALLHGDLWTGNMLVAGGRLVGLVDPACYHGDAEVDLAMLDLFCAPPPEFRDAYGPLEPGWRERLPLYQLFPALVHLRLWGPHYLPMIERLLATVGA
jgi:fructosamine-3-kinase